MAVEIGVVCAAVPDVGVTARMAGLVMRAALGGVGVDVRVGGNPDVWTFAWGGGVSARVIPVAPGRHEFDDAWYLSVEPGQRGVDVALLFAVVVSASAALIAGGVVFDECGLVGGGQVDPAVLLSAVRPGGGTPRVASAPTRGPARRSCAGRVPGRALARLQLSTGFGLAVSPAVITALAYGPGVLWGSLAATTLVSSVAAVVR